MSRGRSSDIAYTVWLYWRATGDDTFMVRYGAEMILDTAVFWGCRAEWNTITECYEISNIIGPDQFHKDSLHLVEAFPDAVLELRYLTTLQMSSSHYGLREVLDRLLVVRPNFKTD